MSTTDATTAASRDVVRAALARLPRVDLGVARRRWNRSPADGGVGGPRLDIKRDDLAGGPLGGNKTRMLEFVLAKAVAAGATAVVGGSAAQYPTTRDSSPPGAPGSDSTAISCCA